MSNLTSDVSEGSTSDWETVADAYDLLSVANTSVDTDLVSKLQHKLNNVLLSGDEEEKDDEPYKKTSFKVTINKHS